MALSTILLLLWVLVATAILKGWAVTRLWLPVAVLILGIAFVVFTILEFLGIVRVQVRRPQPRAAAPPPPPAPPVQPGGSSPQQPAV